MDVLLRRLFRSAAHRGLRGDHWAWFVVAGAAFLLQRAMRRQDPVVYSRRVEPGDRLLLSIRPPDGKAAEPHLAD